MTQSVTKLPQDMLLATFDYDEQTGRLIWKQRADIDDRNNARLVGRAAGYRTATGAMAVDMHGNNFLVAHVIWKMKTGDNPRRVFHKNGDKSDNRFENLREASGWVVPKKAEPTSPITATINVRGVKITLGTFPSVREAASAKAAAMLKYGEQL